MAKRKIRVEAINIKTGEKDGRSWMQYQIKDQNGKWYGTFKASLFPQGDFSLVRKGDFAYIESQWLQQYTQHNLLSYEPATPGFPDVQEPPPSEYPEAPHPAATVESIQSDSFEDIQAPPQETKEPTVRYQLMKNAISDAKVIIAHEFPVLASSIENPVNNPVNRENLELFVDASLRLGITMFIESYKRQS